jgi:hypothetical protein
VFLGLEPAHCKVTTYAGQHEHRTKTTIFIVRMRIWKPRSQCFHERRLFIPYTTEPLWSVCFSLWFWYTFPLDTLIHFVRGSIKIDCFKNIHFFFNNPSLFAICTKYNEQMGGNRNKRGGRELSSAHLYVGGASAGMVSGRSYKLNLRTRIKTTTITMRSG